MSEVERLFFVIYATFLNMANFADFCKPFMKKGRIAAFFLNEIRQLVDVGPVFLFQEVGQKGKQGQEQHGPDAD
jgi:hypothetical protein